MREEEVAMEVAIDVAGEGGEAGVEAVLAEDAVEWKEARCPCVGGVASARRPARLCKAVRGSARRCVSACCVQHFKCTAYTWYTIATLLTAITSWNASSWWRSVSRRQCWTPPTTTGSYSAYTGIDFAPFVMALSRQRAANVRSVCVMHVCVCHARCVLCCTCNARYV